MGKSRRRKRTPMGKEDCIRIGRAIQELQKEYRRTRDEAVDRIEEELADLNVSCIFGLFTVYLAENFQLPPDKIIDALNYIDTEIGKLGNEYPTASELKIRCALKSGVAVLLNDEEKKILDDINDEKYKYIIEYDECKETYSIEKCLIEECGDSNNVICITFNALDMVKRSSLISRDTKIYDTYDEAKTALATYK